MTFSACRSRRAPVCRTSLHVILEVGGWLADRWTAARSQANHRTALDTPLSLPHTRFMLSGAPCCPAPRSLPVEGLRGERQITRSHPGPRHAAQKKERGMPELILHGAEGGVT